MLHLLGNIQHLTPFYLAISGGVDSMSVADFLWAGGHDFTAVFYHHDIPFETAAQKVVEAYCASHGIELIVGALKEPKPSDQSQEEFWRNKRYEFFASLPRRPIITAHHLNDQMENYLATSISGNPKLIPYHNEKANVFRPFLLTRKEELRAWAVKHRVPYLEDPTNADLSHVRNRIRHVVLPEVLKVNPGFFKVIAKKVKQEFECRSGLTRMSSDLVLKN